MTNPIKSIPAATCTPLILWTKDMVKAQLASDQWVIWAITAMHQRQQDAEQIAKASFIADGVGLSKFDAYPISTCRQLLASGECLTRALVDDCRGRLSRYAEQIADALNQAELDRCEDEDEKHAFSAALKALKKDRKPRQSKPRALAASLANDLSLMRYNLKWAEEFIEGKYCEKPKPKEEQADDKPAIKAVK